MEGVAAEFSVPRTGASLRQIFTFTTSHRRWLMLVSSSKRIGPTAHLYGEEAMTIDPVLINPLIALIAGILILLMPRLLNYVVAIYLIAIGIIGLAHHFQ